MGNGMAKSESESPSSLIKILLVSWFLMGVSYGEVVEDFCFITF